MINIKINCRQSQNNNIPKVSINDEISKSERTLKN